MSCSIQTEAESMVQLLMRGDLEEISDKYAFPAVVHVGAKVVLMTGKHKLMKALYVYRDLLLAAGLQRITTKVVQGGLAFGDQCSIFVANEYTSVSGTSLGSAKISYFCERHDGDLKIRMVEYL